MMLKDNLYTNFRQELLLINDYDDVDCLLFYKYIDKYIIFNSVAVKNYFISSTDRNVINCNSSYSKFLKDMDSYDNLTVFNNVGHCTDENILNIIKNTNNLLIE